MKFKYCKKCLTMTPHKRVEKLINGHRTFIDVCTLCKRES